jgi:membrane-bound lytic murein transglycosylase B
MRHEAIYATHPNVASIDDTAGAFDADGNAVVIDEDLVESKIPELIAERQAAQARSERDRLLSQSDWTQVTDAPVDQAAWAEYRQALRDVPQQAGFPTEIAWPVKPE